jgi:hypothetical protein
MKKEKERGEKSDYDGDYDSDGDCGAVIGGRWGIRGFRGWRRFSGWTDATQELETASS